MARRKRKEESTVWSPPEFDEIAFMRREIEGAKASVVTVAWAVLGALLSYGLFSLGGALSAVAAFFAGLLFAFALPAVMPRLRLRTGDFKRKDWAGHGSIYFFSWLAFWILLLNAPFADFTSPTVHSFSVASFSSSAGVSEGVLTCFPASGSVALSLGTNDSVYVIFRATDNLGSPGVQVRVNTVPVSSSAIERLGNQANPCNGANPRALPPDTYAIRFLDSTTTAPYEVVVTATDSAGHVADGRVLVTIGS